MSAESYRKCAEAKESMKWTVGGDAVGHRAEPVLEGAKLHHPNSDMVEGHRRTLGGGVTETSVYHGPIIQQQCGRRQETELC